MTTNILVIGGTGKTGRRVVTRLQALNQNVRIGTPSSESGFDWNNPDTFPAALRGMDKAYVVYYPDLAVPGAKDAIKALVHAAKKEGLQKLVLLSGRGEVEAQKCEQIVANSGLDYTVVCASWFMQNFSESFFLDPILAGHVALPKSEVKVPYIHADDIAAVVVEALLNDAQNGKLIELTGPTAHTFPEVIQKIAQASGRTIQFSTTTVEAYVQSLKSLDVPESYVWLIDYLFSNVLDAPGNNVISHDIEGVLGRKAIDFDSFVQETAKTGVWNQPITQSI